MNITALRVLPLLQTYEYSAPGFRFFTESSSDLNQVQVENSILIYHTRQTRLNQKQPAQNSAITLCYRWCPTVDLLLSQRPVGSARGQLTLVRRPRPSARVHPNPLTGRPGRPTPTERRPARRDGYTDRLGDQRRRASTLIQCTNYLSKHEFRVCHCHTGISIVKRIGHGYGRHTCKIPARESGINGQIGNCVIGFRNTSPRPTGVFL